MRVFSFRQAPAFHRSGRRFKRDDDALLALTMQEQEDEELLLITQQGTTVRQSVAAISQQGRAATGVRL